MSEFNFRDEKPKVLDGIIPMLSFPTHINGTMPSEAKNLDIISITGKLSCYHKFILVSEPQRCHVSFNTPQVSGNHSFNFVMDRITIEAIEKYRKDDIEFQVDIDVVYNLHFGNAGSRTKIHQSRIQRELSQKQWIEILGLMGYGDSWIFEVSRLHIEGMTDVSKHLVKAKANLETHSYEDCMANVRAAWNSFNPLFSAKKEELAGILDANDKPIEGYDPKSKRVQEIKKAINAFVQVGVHRETFTPTHLDAELSFYQTITMISYLSKLLRQIQD